MVTTSSGPESSPQRIIVGAGAAGLWAAARSAQAGKRVLVLEKTGRCGTKILASGGTRCNLTTTLEAGPAARLFGPRAERFLRIAFRTLPPTAVREQFASLGVPTVEAPLEKVFPASDRARDVRDALERWARESGAQIEVSAPVAGVTFDDGTWTVRLADGSTRSAPELVLAAGGQSYPKSGTTGEGYRWLEELDLPLTSRVPALVPLVSPAAWVHELTGIALQTSDVRLLDESGKTVARRTRPVVFTHHGLSGPGAMDLSEPVARSAAEARAAGRPAPLWSIALDVVPGTSREDLRSFLIEAAARPGRPLLRKALGKLARDQGEALPRRLLETLLLEAGIEAPDQPTHALSKAARHRLIETVKGLAVPVTHTRGFELAEVTAGGLALDAVDPGSMRVNGRAGLFVIGELLDRAGPIGGLNFQAAFAEAELCGRA